MSKSRTPSLSIEALEDRTTPSTLIALTGNNQLLRFDSATPNTIQSTLAITGLGANETVRGIDFRPRTGQLIASTVTTGSVSNSIVRTYSVNALTGAATFIGASASLSGAADVPGGYDFNPTVDRLRYVNTNDLNVRINPNNGTLAGVDTGLTPAVSEDIIGEAYDRNFDRQNNAGDVGTLPTTLYAINRIGSQLARQGGVDGVPSPNGGVITNIGPLGVTLDAAADGGFDITSDGKAFAALTSGGTTRLYTINLVSGAASLVDTIGNGATGVNSLTAVPVSTLVVGADAGGVAAIQVRVAFTGAITNTFNPFPGFGGGVRVASGDVNRDGIADVVAAAGPGGGPIITVFDGTNGAVLYTFFAFDSGFRNGAEVAVGDVNRDGFQDIIAGAGIGGAPHVKVFSGRDLSVLSSFFAYDAGFRGGVRVASGDFNLDGTDEIVTVAGPGGGPHVRIFDGLGAPFVSAALPNLSNSFFSYDGSVRNGGYLAVGDVNGDGAPDIVTGPDTGDVAHVKVFSGRDTSLLASFFAFATSIRTGARVAVADFNADGRGEILAAVGPGVDSTIRTFDDLTLAQLDDFSAFPGFIGGVFVGGSRS